MEDGTYLTYRSADGSLYVDFLFKEEKKSWYVYICSEIDFQGQDSDTDVTHQIEDDPYNYICWNRDIHSFQKAKAVAALWADTIALYIKGYGDFDSIARILSASRRTGR